MTNHIDGFISQLVDEVSKRANFTPVRVAIDHYPDSWQESGEDYDMVAADLSVTEERNMNMEFSLPFMRYGLTVLMQKVPKQAVNIFAMTQPFSSSTWLLVILSYILMSLLLLLTSRLDQSPPSPLACLWLPLASLLGQSTNWLPSSPAPRLLITAWWLFVVLTSAAYTANLAAFLTVSRWVLLTIQGVEKCASVDKGIWSRLKGLQLWSQTRAPGSLGATGDIKVQ